MSAEQIETVGPNLPPDKPEIGQHPAQCPVIGLGASAGGLEAFQTFLTAVPADSGHAFVLVQHLDPNHESMLAELLSRRTSMPVRQITDGMPIEPNHVYLIPPNASLVIEKATLRLSEFSEPRGFRRPIDVFFRSLAVDQGTNAACIVLSGTGGDGAEGLRAVKEAGGLTLVQEPDSAKYDGMPNSAVATGLVDRVLAVRDMPAAISDFFSRSQEGISALPDDADFLLKVCEELRHRLGHDFSQYKRTTMLRRIHRRMQVLAAETAETYLQRLRSEPTEAELLFRDLLINVTCFFRDAEAFDYLRREVIPKLLKDRGAGDIVRIWTPGCSSGEEAYSLAILLSETMSRMEVRPRVQIFATDIDEPMLSKARQARYPHTAVKDVPLELLDRYFFAQDDDYVLIQQIRDMVRVSNHNLIKDPPFSRVDMIVCRNLLIYLNPALQQRLVPVFHYGLRSGGFLFLGSAENIANRSDLFETQDAVLRIFRRKVGARQSVAMPLSGYPLVHAAIAESLGEQPRHHGQQDRVDPVARRVMELYAPPYVVVNQIHDVVRSSRRTGKYLEMAEGSPSIKVTDLAKRGLRGVIRALLETVGRTGRPALKRDVVLRSGRDVLSVDVTADPLPGEEILLVFEERASSDEEAQPDVDTDLYKEEESVRQLEDELDETRSKLRTTVEELETSNEELKSTNEEMMSMNEELQSTNEELATVNEELKNKVDQLARTNSDLQNFIESTQVPTIFLDRKLRIRSFTPSTRALFRFQDQDKGRPLSDLVTRVDRGVLEDISTRVIETGKAVEQELLIDDGSESYVLRALPYRGADDSPDGVILVFADTSNIRKAQADIARNEGIARRRSDEIEKLYKTAPVGMALLDRNRRCLKINQRFANLNGRTIEEHIGRTLMDMAPWLAERIERPVQEVFEGGEALANLEVTLSAHDGEPAHDYLIDIYPYEEDQRVTAVGLILKEVTEIRHLEKELRRLMDELQHRVKNTLATVSSIITRTASTKTDRFELADTLKKRIGALAATHDLLTVRDWQGAPLQKIIETELDPFGQSDRITLSGPAVELPPKHALAMTLTLHELATNAAKYGALSSKGGTLSVSWAVNLDGDGRRLTLDWREKCNQPCAPPKTEGFGMQLIKNAVPHDLKGRCEHTVTPEGVRCKLTVPY